MTSKPDVSTDAVTAWLHERFDASIQVVEALSGGYWSAAFGFMHEGRDLVIRFNESAEGFEIDRAAYRFSESGLPIPQVLETGKALGARYAISNRLYGGFLENADPGDASRLSASLGDLLAAMRRVPSDNQVTWYDRSASMTWHDYLLNAISEPVETTDEAVRSLYEESTTRIKELLPACPERRDLVHGDLLHQNVLISDKAEAVTAVFSWKCSAFGDFMYDVAWCTHWSPWHPGIAAVDVYDLTRNAIDLDDAARENMTERHHCYELQIAASHIGWYLWTKDDENLHKLCSELRGILDRGPLPS